MQYSVLYGGLWVPTSFLDFKKKFYVNFLIKKARVTDWNWRESSFKNQKKTNLLALMGLHSTLSERVIFKQQ